MSKNATLLAGLGHYADPQNGGLVPPIQSSVTSVIDGSEGALGYARSGNSAVLLAESLLNTLEKGQGCAFFNAGASAAWAVLATLKPGDGVILEADCYYEFRSIISRYCERLGIALTLVDLCNLEAVEQATRQGHTNLIWAELPTNPLWKIADIQAVATLAHQVGARLIVDATVATPLWLNALKLGADVVLHSATKYLNGHGDLTAGALVTAKQDAWWQEITAYRTASGSVLPSMEAWLLLRGMRTLSLRVERASENTLKIARWLAQQPAVSVVHYPGLEQNPHFPLAQAQFAGGFGAMLSFQLRAGAKAASEFCLRTSVFRHSTSLGSTESLIEHRRSTEGEGSRCPDDLLRLSVGIEDSDDLLADLAQALAATVNG
ncbi:trans-sulfuration enzyme family protein [Erwinia sp.]|uniref:trans-sulfuration enzyme family protein n=1 Tax=Erwinia citreus TaxID=558 RepID=UPI003C75F4BC